MFNNSNCFVRQSDDATVFFFSIGKKYKPIGFIETEGAVASLDWSNSQEASVEIISIVL